MGHHVPRHMQWNDLCRIPSHLCITHFQKKKKTVRERSRPQRRQRYFGIQPTYQSYCRSTGKQSHSSELPVTSLAKYYPIQNNITTLHSSYWLSGRKWCILTFRPSCWFCRQKERATSSCKTSSKQLQNTIQPHIVPQIIFFIKHFCFATATTVSHPVVKVAKWHQHYYHSNIPLK